MSQYDALVWNEEQIIEGKIARASLAEQLRSHAHLLSNEVN